MNSRIASMILVGLMSAVMAVTAHAGPFRNSLSVSPRTDYLFDQGYVFKDAQGNTARNREELQKLYVKHGATEVYARIATNRFKYNIDGLDHSLQTAVSKALMAKKLGLPFNPEIGVFDH